MKRFLFSQPPDESERSSNIVRGDVILALDFLERHAPARLPTTTVTGTRVPRMTGLPSQMAGSMTIRLCVVISAQMIVIWLDLSSLASRHDVTSSAQTVVPA